jgi:putative GTP pyrophosphokinase
MDISAAVDQFWAQRAGEVRSFLERQPRYEKLSEEVAYVLEKVVREKQVEYASVTFREKSLNSFCEKVLRKGYKKPLEEITDFAGVRIVYLYASDREKIESLIEKEFTIVEKVDTEDKGDIERFGYAALHYVVKLSGKSSGARYDDLRELSCELQVRTILQDAWAIVAHHLSYKQETDVPVELRRKLNALSGLFETADDQFDRLKDDRAEYKKQLRKKIKEEAGGVLDVDINLDNLATYLSSRLPDRRQSSLEGVAMLLGELSDLGYHKLEQLDDVISRGYDAVKAYEKKYPPGVSVGEKPVFAAVGVARMALKIVNWKKPPGDKMDSSEKRYMEFQHLVKK